jgi:hypothetical protein
MTTTAVVPFSLSSLFANVEGAVTTDVQSWLIQEYATLAAMPQTLARFASVQQALVANPRIATDPTYGPTLSGIGVSIQGLISGYPQMIQPVNNAVIALQAARTSGVTVSTGTDIAIAAAGAQQFTSGAATVQSDLLALVQQALASGAITPTQAQAYTTQLSADGSAGWGKYLLYAVGAYVAYRLIKKVL